jgi:hypothetical protein
MEWDLGDYVPLTFHVPEGDLTTGVTVAWLAPDATTGTVSPAPATSDAGKTWTTSHQVNQVGPWVFTFTITGMGAGIDKLTVFVSALPPPPWVPGLRAIADYVPTRTIESGDLTQTPQMTFTTDTTPSGEQVYRQIRAAVRWVISRTGTVKEVLYGAARDVAAIRTAGMIELSWPSRDAGINTARELLTQAEAALKDLVISNSGATDVEPGDPGQALLPVWYAPDPTTTETIPVSDTADWGSHEPWWRGGEY